MKLFLNTAVLCVIPKLVNAAEKQLQDWLTPDVPSNKQLEQDAKIKAENREAFNQIASPENRKRYSVQAEEVPFDLLDDQDVAQEQITAEVPSGTARGNGTTITEKEMGSAYHDFVTEKETPPVKHRAHFTKNMHPITKEVHDYINAMYIEMVKRNKIAGKTNGCYPFNALDAARATNQHYDEDWGLSTLSKCLAKPGSITRIERDDCPSHEEVYGTPPQVIRSVSQFSDMDLLNIKT